MKKLIRVLVNLMTFDPPRRRYAKRAKVEKPRKIFTKKGGK